MYFNLELSRFIREVADSPSQNGVFLSVKLLEIDMICQFKPASRKKAGVKIHVT